MNNTDQEIQTIQKNLKGIKNQTIRKRALMLLRGLQTNNIKLASDTYGVSRQTYYFWLKRLRKADYDIRSLLNESKAPKTNKRMIPEKTIQLAIKVSLENYNVGAENTAWLLEKEHNIKIHASTLGYIFRRLNISKQYRKPKKNQHTKRYAAEKALDRTQQDTVNLEIVDNNGIKVKAYPVVDDCSRVTTVHVADEHSNYEATNAFQKFVEKFGKPKVSQTDNGAEFTNKYLSEENPKRKKEAVKSGYEQFLGSNQIRHKLIRPRTPQLNGKVERFNYTLKRSLKGKIQDGMTVPQIQKIVNEFSDWYNNIRPHKSLNGLTPYQVFYQNLEPKGEP